MTLSENKSVDEYKQKMKMYMIRPEIQE